MSHGAAVLDFPVEEQNHAQAPLIAAEFFAGIGLVRCGLEQSGVDVVWANDIEPVKRTVYAANFGASDFHLGDIRDISGRSVAAVDLATASFPCVDLSLAGHRRGLSGEQSGLFYEFTRILRELRRQAPSVVMVENVASFVSSRGGQDLRAAVGDLNALGYVCDLLVLDAKWFTPQSRPRLFVIGTRGRLAPESSGATGPARPERLASFIRSNPDLLTQELPLPVLPRSSPSLSEVVERLAPHSARWWGADRYDQFIRSLSPRHARRLDMLRRQPLTAWRTAYRRTRAGTAVWEVRDDEIAGCLRTARGGSSRQAVVEAGCDSVRVRWMTPREYARLQGAPEDFDFSSVTEAQALYGFGDAVCVPLIAWLARHALVPAARSLAQTAEAA